MVGGGRVVLKVNKLHTYNHREAQFAPPPKKYTFWQKGYFGLILFIYVFILLSF